MVSRMNVDNKGWLQIIMPGQLQGCQLINSSMIIETLSQNRNYQFWVLQLAGWMGWIILFTIRGLQFGDSTPHTYLLFLDALAGILLTTGLRYIYHIVWNKSVVTRVLTVLIASYAIAAIWQPIKNYASFVYFDEFESVKHYGMMAYFAGILGYSYFLMLCWSGLYFGIKFYQLWQEQIQWSIKAESMAHEAQLRMLRYQLNPHFLFNTLNAISTLILDKSTDTANEMVSKLSNFLRYSLDKDPMQKVELDHEISTMKLYLDIEKVRFEERLTVEFDIEEAAKKALVPSLILQPMVENSLKYAVANRESGGTISLRAKVFAGDLLLEVEDDGPGIQLEMGKQPEFTGVGLVNTRERLHELYGDKHSCKFTQALPHGLKIEIRIPLETEQ